jgi:hypothetical protein
MKWRVKGRISWARVTSTFSRSRGRSGDEWSPPPPLYRHALQRRCIFDSLGKLRLQFGQKSCRVPSGHRLPEGGEAGHFRCAISP